MNVYISRGDGKVKQLPGHRLD